MYKFFFLTLFLFAEFGLVLVHSAEVNLYTHRHYPSDQDLFDEFTAKTGIKVNVVKAKASQLLQRLELEGEKTPADLFITSDVAMLHKAREKNLLQAIPEKSILNKVPLHLRDQNGQWVALTKRARVMVYNEKFVKKSELSNLEALADSKWKGRILVRSSTNEYNQSLVASMIAHHGKDKAMSWCEALVKNFARTPKGNDRDQMRAVIAGEGDIAIVNSYYLGKLLTGDEKDQKIGKQLSIFWPNQDGYGAHVNVSGAGLTKHSKNKAQALKLLEFLLSEKAQKSLADSNHEYPVVKGVSASDLVSSWGDFKADELPLSKLGELNKEAVKIMDYAGWK